jgi:hypothetical protein
VIIKAGVYQIDAAVTILPPTLAAVAARNPD